VEQTASDFLDVLSVIPKGTTAHQMEGARLNVKERASFKLGPEYDGLRAKMHEFEGYRKRPYVDSKGYASQGYGHKLGNKQYTSEFSAEFKRDWAGEPSMSKERADMFFESDLQNHYGRLRQIYPTTGGLQGAEIPFEKLPLQVREVMIDASFNMGADGFATKFPTMLQSVRDGNFRKAGIDLMYRQGGNVEHMKEGKREFSSYYISNNGPDRYVDSERNIFMDPDGLEYSARDMAVPLDADGNAILDLKKHKGPVQWFSIPSVDNTTGLHFKPKNPDTSIDYSVGVRGSSMAVTDLRSALISAKDRKEMDGPFRTQSEAEAAPGDINLGEIKAMKDTRANYNVGRMMGAPDVALPSTAPPEDTAMGGFLQDELKQ
jgi:GH24 family phage-related lysozyme (muramidase)